MGIFLHGYNKEEGAIPDPKKATRLTRRLLRGVVNRGVGNQVHSPKLTWKWRGALSKTTILCIGPFICFHVNLGEGTPKHSTTFSSTPQVSQTVRSTSQLGHSDPESTTWLDEGIYLIFVSDAQCFLRYVPYLSHVGLLGLLGSFELYT